MIPAAFEYHRPTTVNDALALLEEHGEGAKILAGGHSLVPLMKLRLAAPEHLIDIGRIGGLNYLRDQDGDIAIGALTTHSQVAASALLRERATALAEGAAAIGDVQIRNRGTIGGSLAHADPGADLPGVILALNAKLVARGLGGERTIAAGDFFTELFTTALAPDELLVEVRIPGLPPHSGSTYLKMANQASGYALVGIAAVVTLDGDTITDARVGISGVAETALRATATEAALRGKSADDATVKAAAALASQGVEAMGDIHASAEFRTHLVNVYTERALLQAIARAR